MPLTYPPLLPPGTLGNVLTSDGQGNWISAPAEQQQTPATTKVNVALNKLATISGWTSQSIKPGNLARITDGDFATKSSEGATFGQDMIGVITIDLGNNYEGILRIKMGLRMAFVNGSGQGQWQVTATDSSNIATTVYFNNSAPGTTEKVINIYQLFIGRYLNFYAYDLGQGQAAISLYEVKALVDL